jgi:hypothetical protein
MHGHPGLADEIWRSPEMKRGTRIPAAMSAAIGVLGVVAIAGILAVETGPATRGAAVLGGKIASDPHIHELISQAQDMTGPVREAFIAVLKDQVANLAGFSGGGTPLVVDTSIGVNPDTLASALRDAGFNARSVGEIFGTTKISDSAIGSVASAVGGRVLNSDRGRDLGGGFAGVGVFVPQTVNKVDTFVRILKDKGVK